MLRGPIRSSQGVTDVSKKARFALWLLYGLVVPVSPILIAALLILQDGGSVTLGAVAGRGELELASVGVYTSVIAQLAGTGLSGEFPRVLLAINVVLVLIAGATYGGLISRLTMGGSTSVNGVVGISLALLLGGVILGVMVATVEEERA
jgi:hypothetical protein